MNLRDIQTGEIRVARTNARGYYVFRDVQAGTIYMVNAFRPAYSFAPSEHLFTFTNAIKRCGFYRKTALI